MAQIEMGFPAKQTIFEKTCLLMPNGRMQDSRTIYLFIPSVIIYCGCFSPIEEIMIDECGYVSIEESLKAVTVIALIVIVLSPILIFFGLLYNAFHVVYDGIVNTVKGAVNALQHLL